MNPVTRHASRLEFQHLPKLKAVAIALIALGFSGCSYLGGKSIEDIVTFSSADMGVQASSRVVSPKARSIPKGGGRRQIGKPYTINGKTYYPKYVPDYNKTGLASWYGSKFHGRLTANGEIFDMHSISAAHPTMPLPSYAEVINLENGRSIIVRVNDRGPFMHNRLIDLSKRSSQLLGFNHKGVAKVRVKYLGEAGLAGSDDEKLEASLKLNGKSVTNFGSELASVDLNTRKGRALETSKLLKAASQQTQAKGFSLGSAYKSYSQRRLADNNLITNSVSTHKSASRQRLTKKRITADLSGFKPMEKNLLKLAGMIGQPDAETSLKQAPVSSVKVVPLPTKKSLNPPSHKAKAHKQITANIAIPKPKLRVISKHKPLVNQTTQTTRDVTAVTPKPEAKKAAITTTFTGYHIQVSRFRDLENAERTLPALPKDLAPTIKSITQDGTTIHLVLTRDFANLNEAKNALSTMSQRGFLSARIVKGNQ